MRERDPRGNVGGEDETSRPDALTLRCLQCKDQVVDEAGLVEATERDRLRCLVDGDVEAARGFHADDFQRITPTGQALSQEEYLNLVDSRHLVYIAWRPAAIVVRMYGDVAVLRYQASIQGSFGGELFPRMRTWHTDIYERRDGRWQVVWSQATEFG